MTSFAGKEPVFHVQKWQKLGVDFPFFVGPMVGISHVATRRLVRDYLPRQVQAMLFTEMLSTRRLPCERLDRVHELKTDTEFGQFIPQILGNEEKFIAASLRKLEALQPFGFDINMGCPVKHTLRHNWGVRLMGDMSYAAQVVGWTKKHTHLPVGVKLRAGADTRNDRYLLDFVQALEAAGADWLTIHARTALQKHSGPASWDLVGEIAAQLQIPVIANGDIQTADDAIKTLTDHGAGGAMIGRAITARPWLLGQIAWKMQQADPLRYPFVFDKPPPMTPEAESREYFCALDRYIDLLEQHFGDEDYCLKKLRFFIATGSVFFLFGHAFWKMSMKDRSLKDLRHAIQEYGARSRHEWKDRANL